MGRGRRDHSEFLWVQLKNIEISQGGPSGRGVFGSEIRKVGVLHGLVTWAFNSNSLSEQEDHKFEANLV